MKLMKDVLRPYVPEFRKEIEKHGECILFCIANRYRCWFNPNLMREMMENN